MEILGWVNMEIFAVLLLKIIPLYFIIVLGFIAGRFLGVKKESIAPLLIYIITPFVVFNGVISANLTAGVLSLPLIFFSVSSVLCLFFYFIARFIYKTSEKNILAFAAGAGNTGYFGLPVAIAVFGQGSVPLVVLSVLGVILYENSVGFFMIAKGSNTTKQSLLRVARLPSLYAFLLGILAHVFTIQIGSEYSALATNFQGAYSILGMMLIGLGISTFSRLSFDIKFISLSFVAKFIGYPIIILFIIFIDSLFFKLFTTEIRSVMILLSIVPLAANTVAFATALNVHPEKAAMAVLLSTIVALGYIPLIITLLRL